MSIDLHTAPVLDTDIISAKAFILDPDNNVLLLKKINGEMDIPGGHPDPGENPREALIRETFEETGLEIGGLAMKLAVTIPKKNGTDASRAFYIVEAPRTLAIPRKRLSGEHRAAKWVPVKAAASKLDHPAQREALKTLKKRGQI